MNKRLAIEDFGYQDFILIKGSYTEVLEALKEVVLESDQDAKPSKNPVRFLKTVLKRIPFKKKASDAVEEAPQTDEKLSFTLLAEDKSAPVDLITTERGPLFFEAADLPGPEAHQDDIRLSGIDGSDWVLIEYREQLEGLSLLGFSLSLKLADRDVLYFRRSGDLICEYHNDFHVYRDGDATRRVVCHSTWPEGEIEQEWWENTLDGEISPYEPSGLYQDTGEMDLLDNEKLDEILAKLALSTQKLFSRVLTIDPVLLSRRTGGTPLVAD